MLYDVSFDDGDEEGGVLAGRVRAVGQCPPALQAGLAVDVKLARKGKVGGSDDMSRTNTRHDAMEQTAVCVITSRRSATVLAPMCRIRCRPLSQRRKGGRRGKRKPPFLSHNQNPRGSTVIHEHTLDRRMRRGSALTVLIFFWCIL